MQHWAGFLHYHLGELHDACNHHNKRQGAQVLKVKRGEQKVIDQVTAAARQCQYKSGGCAHTDGGFQLFGHAHEGAQAEYFYHHDIIYKHGADEDEQVTSHVESYAEKTQIIPCFRCCFNHTGLYEYASDRLKYRSKVKWSKVERIEMKKYFDGLAILMASAWVGGMWMAGYIAAPVLFQTLTDKSLAGLLAGKLFAVTAYMGMVCAVYLLVYVYATSVKRLLRRGIFWIIVSMLLIILLGQFGIQPQLAELKAQALPLYVMDSPYAGSFRLWHGVASMAYLVQSVLGAVLLLKMYSART